MTQLLSRADILKANDLPTRDVPVPEWGGMVRVRSMTAKDRDDFETAFAEARKNGESVNLRARYAAHCIVDEKGKPVFNSEDIEALGQKSAEALNRVFEAISDLNRLSPDDVEEAAKN